MPASHPFGKTNLIVLGTVAVLFGFLSNGGTADAQAAARTNAADPRLSVVIPLIDAERGRRLFITKGCFICHSVKGVGGKAAPALDAPSGSRQIDVLDFVARMWKGAPLMFELQAMELGYRIELTREEIADLAGFVGDARAQQGFAKEEIPEVVREWILDEAWWDDRSLDLGDILPENYPDLDGPLRDYR